MSVAAARPMSDDRTGAARRDRTLELAALATPLLLAALVRIAPAVGTGFPAGDGGMFYVMAREIDRAGMTLPSTTAYNGAGIPFAYPPLGLWLAALLGRIVPLVDVFHWWPIAWSILTVPACYLVARRLTGSWVVAVVAATAFALVPRSFEWLITGGAVTRAPGYVFAILAIHQALVAFDDGRRRNVVAAAVLAGLATLTHPNAALFAVLSIGILGLSRTPRRRSLAFAAAILAGAAVVSAPWWLGDLVRFGSGTLVSAMGAGSRAGPATGVFYLVTFAFAEEPFLPWIAGLGMIGIAWSLARRQFLLPAWLVACLLVDARGGPGAACLPLSILAAIAVTRVVPAMLDVARPDAPPLELLRPRRVRIAVGALFVLALLGSLYRPLQQDWPDHTLGTDVRTAMTWVASNTAPTDTFAVVTGQGSYADVVAEWFPALASRVSVSTVQGHEWLGGPDLWRQQDVDSGLQGCATAGPRCLDGWMTQFGIHPTYVFLPKGRIAGPLSPADCCTALRDTLAASVGYRLTYDGPGASIFSVASP